MHATNVLAIDYMRENEWLRNRVAELEAQLEAMRPHYVKVGAYTVDLRSGWYSQHAVPAGHLTRTETRLLACLAMTPGQMVSYETIGAMAWPEMTHAELERVVKVNLSRLRAKIDPSFTERSGAVTGSRHFRTARGVGVGFIP